MSQRLVTLVSRCTMTEWKTEPEQLIPSRMCVCCGLFWHSTRWKIQQNSWPIQRMRSGNIAIRCWGNKYRMGTRPRCWEQHQHWPCQLGISCPKVFHRWVDILFWTLNPQKSKFESLWRISADDSVFVNAIFRIGTTTNHWNIWQGFPKLRNMLLKGSPSIFGPQMPPNKLPPPWAPIKWQENPLCKPW